ncbi:hypothetical protein TNCV_2453471 [Trichonephila clavipes]|nr:hypothetical protein TNCV_2453471 [Trichonephila clavipes]
MASIEPWYSRWSTAPETHMVKPELHNSFIDCMIGTVIQLVIPRLTLPLFMRIRSDAVFKSRRFVFCLKNRNLGKIGKICTMIEESVKLARQINLEVDSDDVQELLVVHPQELTLDEFIEMQKREQDLKKLSL